jgi:hypothetical protein
MSSWIKIIGTQTGRFVLGLTGASLKNTSGTIEVKNNADSAFAPLAAQELSVNNNTSGYAVTLKGNNSQSADYDLVLPVDDGTAGQVLSTDGTGGLSWASAGNTDLAWKADTTSVEFGSSSTITAFTLPANAVVDRVSIIVDTPFDGTPTLSVGVNGGSASQYAGSGDSSLLLGDRFDVPNQSEASGSTQDIEIYYSAGGATAGAARIIVTYAIPA